MPDSIFVVIAYLAMLSKAKRGIDVKVQMSLKSI